MFIVSWPVFKVSRTFCSVALLGFGAGFTPGVVWADVTDNLWLPGSYLKLMPKLRKSAEKLEASERCDKVLEGKLHDSTRNEEHATFFLICRDASRKTFPVLVDANTLELDFPLWVEPEPEPEPEPRDLEAERRARIQHAWQVCEPLFAKETRFMQNMTLLTKGQPQPLEGGEGGEGGQGGQGSVSFVIDFDAENLRAQPLHYRAHCTTTNEDAPPELVIEARRDSHAKEASEGQ